VGQLRVDLVTQPNPDAFPIATQREPDLVDRDGRSDVDGLKLLRLIGSTWEIVSSSWFATHMVPRPAATFDRRAADPDR